MYVHGGPRVIEPTINSFIYFQEKKIVFVINRLWTIVLLILLWNCLQSPPVFACRYNVREVGMVDLGIESYYLYGYVNNDTPADVISNFKEIASTELEDTNIKFEIINIDQERAHPAMKYIDSPGAQSFPAAVLVSPDGQTLQLPVMKPNQSFKETFSSAINDILLSPKRKEILQQVAKTYGVVLLIEGPNTPDNERAKKTILAALERIAEQMELMPKPIAHPPVLVTVDSNSLSQEKILLWSLGLDTDKVSEPLAVVLYGRARWLGPLFAGEQIDELNLAEILFVIGADCECGIDHRWLQGTMLPARWDEDLQAQAAESLGFDPEDPMTKTEISWIVRRGYPVYIDAPVGYQEFVVGPESANEDQTIPFTEANEFTSPDSVALDTVSEESVLADSAWPLLKPLYLIAGLMVLIIMVGLFIVFRATRRNL